MKTTAAKINVYDQVDDKESMMKTASAGQLGRPQPIRPRVIYQTAVYR